MRILLLGLWLRSSGVVVWLYVLYGSDWRGIAHWCFGGFNWRDGFILLRFGNDDFLALMPWRFGVTAKVETDIRESLGL